MSATCTCVLCHFVTGKADSWWIKDLNLYIADKNHLESGSEVSNNVINAAHTLLSQQFPHIHGFQNTLLGYRLKFKVVSRIPFVQILHTGTVMCIHKLSSKVNNTLSKQKVFKNFHSKKLCLVIILIGCSNTKGLLLIHLVKLLHTYCKGRNFRGGFKFRCFRG